MYEELSPEDGNARLAEGWAYVDVRTPGEFEGGHPVGAVNVPFSLLDQAGMMQNPAFLAVVSRLFRPDRGLVVGCSNGNRSARACQMLSQMGYHRLALVTGGFSGAHDASGNLVAAGWSASGLPSSRGRDEGSYDAVFARLKLMGSSSST